MIGESGTVGILPEWTDDQVVAKIREVWNLPSNYVIFLDPETYSGTARNIDPE
jgi:hypothetical protein